MTGGEGTASTGSLPRVFNLCREDFTLNDPYYANVVFKPGKALVLRLGHSCGACATLAFFLKKL